MLYYRKVGGIAFSVLYHCRLIIIDNNIVSNGHKEYTEYFQHEEMTNTWDDGFPWSDHYTYGSKDHFVLNKYVQLLHANF